MKPIPLVSGWNLLPFADFLRGIGAPVERWLAESRIWTDVLAEPDRPVPLRHMLDFAERAARAEGAESLGIDVGRYAAAECLGAFGDHLAQCVTLYDRLQTSCALLSLVSNCESLWLEQDGASARLHVRLDVPGQRYVHHGDDFTLMLILEAIGRAAPEGWKPGAIYLPGSRSHRFARDEMFQGVQMVYGAPYVTVVFPAELLSHSLRPLRAVAQKPRSGPQSGIADHEMPSDFRMSVEETVLNLLSFGSPSLHDLADMAGTSPRTLQRWLAACGTSIRRVFDHARFRLADEYLRHSSASVTEIALQLGYGDSTAFTRAFHRIAGVSPATYREQRCDA